MRHPAVIARGRVSVTALVDTLPQLQRARGLARIGFIQRGGVTAVDDIYQSGCARVRFPATEPDHPLEAIVINTAGGLTDGDLFETQAVWGKGASAVVSSQACERIYRSRGGPARLDTRIEVGPGARAFWLPQETILFDGGNIERRIVLDLALNATLVACESVVLGRTAMGETVSSGGLREHWRLRIGGRLEHAENFGLNGDFPAAASTSRLNGARALATLIFVGDRTQECLAGLRDVQDRANGAVAASAIGRVVHVKVAGVDGVALRKQMCAALQVLVEYAGLAAGWLPRVWSI